MKNKTNNEFRKNSHKVVGIKSYKRNKNSNEKDKNDSMKLKDIITPGSEIAGITSFLTIILFLLVGIATSVGMIGVVEKVVEAILLP